MFTGATPSGSAGGLNFATPGRGGGAGAGNMTPSFFGGALSPPSGALSAAPHEVVQRGGGGQLGESMFSSGASASKGGAASLEHLAPLQLQHQHQHAKQHAQQQHVQQQQQQHAPLQAPPRESRAQHPLSRQQRVGEAALPAPLVAPGLGGADDLMLPPATSLLSMVSSRPAPGAAPAGELEEERQAGLRRRQPIPIRTPKTPAQSGLDLGAPRGLDLASPVVLRGHGLGHGLGPGQGGARADEQGMTAAVELITVKSPWVTVFGYPAGAGFLVLRHFQQFGEVHEHRQSGNWMHVLYCSKVQASRALAQNGMFLLVDGQQCMIGVKACTDPSLADVTATASTRTASLSFDAKGDEPYRVRQPAQVAQAPQRATNVCKRFFAWVLDV
jgi:hypothetical protein